MQIRPYQGPDEAELLSIWRSAMTHDRVSEQLFRTKVLLDPNFVADNLPVAVEDGKVIGFVLSLTRQVPLFLQGMEPENAWITAFGVHPDHRHKGIGTALFNRVLDRLKADGRKSVGISPYMPNYFVPGVDTTAYPGTITFLENTMRFRTLYHAISMGANLTGFQIPPELLEIERQREQQDGITVRTVTSADLPDVMPFIVKYFGWDWYRHAADYLLEYFGDSSSQICFLVARRRGEVVGFCQQRRERFGPFGVRPDQRNYQIGRILLFRCLSIMASRHNYYAYFLWTDENAARLYSLAGFKRMREFAVMEKAL